MQFEYNEIITRNKVHSNHFEIFLIDGMVKVKIATAYYKRNAYMIVESLNEKYGIKSKSKQSTSIKKILKSANESNVALPNHLFYLTPQIPFTKKTQKMFLQLLSNKIIRAKEQLKKSKSPETKHALRVRIYELEKYEGHLLVALSKKGIDKK